MRMESSSRRAFANATSLMLFMFMGWISKASTRTLHAVSQSTDETHGVVFQALPYLAEESSSILFHDSECEAFCENVKTNPSYTPECWGKHVHICKGNSSIMVSKCEGHYLGFHVPEKDVFVGICEGLSHKFAHWTAIGPDTRSTKLHFLAKGCLGTGVSSLQRLPAPKPLAPSDVAKVRAMQHDSALTSLMEQLPKVAAAAGEQSSGAAFESRCSGYGGSMYGVKWGRQQQQQPLDLISGDANAVLEKTQQIVEGGLGGIPLKPAAVNEAGDHSVPDADSYSMMSEMVTLARKTAWRKIMGVKQHMDTSDQDSASCSLTCNGHEPWLHGLLPCWGNLTVTCSSNSAPGGKSMSLATSCKGLWTGGLGHMCLGLTLTHSTQGWPVGSAEMWDVCSGRLGVKGHRSTDGASMGKWCHGKAVSHGVFMTHATPDRVSSVALD